MSESVVTTVLSSGILLSVPVIWAAFGEAICEQAGVLNIGIEGVMLLGAFGAALGIKLTGSLYIGLLFAIPFGLGSGAVLAYLYVFRGVDQILAGLMLNILVLGATTMIYDASFSQAETQMTFRAIAIPGLSRIPIIGPALFDQNGMVYAAGGAAILVFYVLRRSWFGLYLRAVGEKPEVAERTGLDVQRLRTVALLLSCSLVSIGGASLVVMVTGSFGLDMTAGQGYVALAIVILARWNPFLIVVGSGLFGLSNALQLQAQSLSFGGLLPHDIWSLLPYVVTIAVLAIAPRGAQYPAACGIPYRPYSARRPRPAAADSVLT